MIYNYAMSKVEFDTDEKGNNAGRSSSVGSVGMARWLISRGWVSGESGAKAVLIGIACLNLVFMGLIIYFFIL